MVSPENVVLEVSAVDGDAPEVIAALTETLRQLREAGFRLAFGAYVMTRPYVAWVPLAGYIKLDMRSLKPETVPAAVRVGASHSHASLIAEKVESAEEFALLEKLGVRYFQGYYFERPTTISARVVSPAYANVIQLINLVRREANVSEIEALLKRDPTLSFKLLRYINSAGFGLSCEITSFRHAVMILGLKNLFRWAAILLTSVKGNFAPPAVANFAVTRARFMELLASECLSAEDRDNAFLTGIFSLLDVMLGVPMAQALENLALPSDIDDALLERAGLLGQLLHLAEACEIAEGDGVVGTACALQLSNEQINRCHLAAIAWAEHIGDPAS
jgi:c-di-GMP-related signal transduction protein